MLFARQAVPTKEEADWLAAQGANPADFVAYPVTLDVQLGSLSAQRAHVGGAARYVLLLPMVTGMDASHFKNFSPLVGAGGVPLRNPLDGCAGSCMAYLLVPRARLNGEGESFIHGWDFNTGSPAWRAGFLTVLDGELDQADDLLSMPAPSEPPSDFEQGLRYARELLATHGRDYLVAVANSQVQAVGSGPLAVGDVPVGRCDICGNVTTGKYCKGTVENPHRERRVFKPGEQHT